MTAPVTIELPRGEWEAVRTRVACHAAAAGYLQPHLACVRVSVRNRRREWEATNNYRAAIWRADHPAEAAEPTLVPAAVFRRAPKDLDTLALKVWRDDDAGAWRAESPLGSAEVVVGSRGWPRLSPILGDHATRPGVDVTLDQDPDRWVSTLRTLREVAWVCKTKRGEPDDPVLICGVGYHWVAGGGDALLLATRGQSWCLPLAGAADGAQVWQWVDPRFLAALVRSAGPGCAIRVPWGLGAVSVTADRWRGALMPVRQALPTPTGTES